MGTTTRLTKAVVSAVAVLIFTGCAGSGLYSYIDPDAADNAALPGKSLPVDTTPVDTIPVDSPHSDPTPAEEQPAGQVEANPAGLVPTVFTLRDIAPGIYTYTDTALAAPDPADPAPVEPVEIGPGFNAQYRRHAVRIPPVFESEGMELPIDLTRVTFLGEYELTDTQLDALSANGFVVAPGDTREFYVPYIQARRLELPFFVTTDSLLHTYHLLFAKVLRDLEDELFYPAIAGMTTALKESAHRQYLAAAGTSLEEEALHAWAYFALAEQLIQESPPAIDPALADLVTGDLDRIMACAKADPSDILSLDAPYIEDFTCYKPRGHYTRTEQRMRYFRTMVWFGRANMRLKYDGETRLALLITRLALISETDSTPVTELWRSVYDPTSFLVGAADDLGLREYSELAMEAFGDPLALDTIADDEKLDAFVTAAREHPGPRINSMLGDAGGITDEATAGFRLMGQRFVLDAYIFQELIEERVVGRRLPSGLDFAAALGNGRAYSILDDRGDTSYPGYPEQMESMRTLVNGLEIEDWSQSVCSNWLYMLGGVFQQKDTAYPPFMQTDAWALKDIQAGLGSWAELKHDTILYAKSATPGPTGFDTYDVLLNYVEPNPEAYSRMRSLVELTSDGMSNYEVLNPAVFIYMAEMAAMLEVLQEIAELELEGGAMTEELYELVAAFPDWVEQMLVKCADSHGSEPGGEPAAIIADVSSDPYLGSALEVGTGSVYDIYVATPDGTGGLQLSRGAVFSYYEFTWPSNNRLTDEQWREMIKNGEQPEQPEWTGGFIIE